MNILTLLDFTGTPLELLRQVEDSFVSEKILSLTIKVESL